MAIVCRKRPSGKQNFIFSSRRTAVFKSGDYQMYACQPRMIPGSFFIAFDAHPISPATGFGQDEATADVNAGIKFHKINEFSCYDS
jgi:hypothetical protein